MRYVLDTSAIINLIIRLEGDVMECLTIDLAYYEMENHLRKSRKADLTNYFLNVLNFYV